MTAYTMTVAAFDTVEDAQSCEAEARIVTIRAHESHAGCRIYRRTGPFGDVSNLPAVDLSNTVGMRLVLEVIRKAQACGQKVGIYG